jgi:hypothetical protein
MSAQNSTVIQQKLKTIHAAQLLTSAQRQTIAIQAIAGQTPVSHVAQSYRVSRKFVYQQKEKALECLSTSFDEEKPDNKVLFSIPVTKQWLSQIVLGLIFICRASYQGVVEFFRDMLDQKISKGSVHNIVHAHLQKAKKINAQKDLSRVQAGLHDEIYQAGDPVLVGCCAHSTYCYLLSLVESCDATSWGFHLINLQDNQGLNPDYTVIDGGRAARCGQKEAWENVPAHGDHFHALHPFSGLVSYLENRALDVLKLTESLKHKIAGRRGVWKDIDKRTELYGKLLKVESTFEDATKLASDVRTLYSWLKNDVLALVGPSYQTRQELLLFIIEELRKRESHHHKVTPIRTYLENHKDNLLEFMNIMEFHFDAIAHESELPLSSVLAVYELQGLAESSQKRWRRHAELQSELKDKFYWVNLLVEEVLQKTIRANSLVENLNSRLRTYFTLRREVGGEYLHFLQFFLNHRRFMRSECEERVNKSPAELLTGEPHDHWLEMLGFELFKQAA